MTERNALMITFHVEKRERDILAFGSSLEKKAPIEA
jgi:hypothetical protein